MPIIQSNFKPAWWLKNSHLQTLWPSLIRRRAPIQIERERFELADGDFIDLDWAGKNKKGPLLIVLHGLGGSINSHYASTMLRAFYEEGWCAVLMHFRGCSGEPNRYMRSYHSGETQDFTEVLNHLRQQKPETALYGLGFSLGGNVLLKYLGEQGNRTLLKAAAAVCAPMDLNASVNCVQLGFSRIYQWYLIEHLKEHIANKAKHLQKNLSVELSTLNTFWEFDDAITAPLHGFSSANEYYTRNSSKQFIKNICIPTLILHAQDDPFMCDAVLPHDDDVPSCVTLEISKHGGHVGFIAGTVPGMAKYWLEERITLFLKNC